MKNSNSDAQYRRVSRGVSCPRVGIRLSYLPSLPLAASCCLFRVKHSRLAVPGCVPEGHALEPCASPVVFGCRDGMRWQCLERPVYSSETSCDSPLRRKRERRDSLAEIKGGDRSNRRECFTRERERKKKARVGLKPAGLDRPPCPGEREREREREKPW